MTKRDFVLIAGVLKKLGDEGAHCFDSASDREAIAWQFAYALEKTNPLFDSDRFIIATRTF